MPHVWKTVSLRSARLLSSALAHLQPLEIENIARLAFRGLTGARSAALETFARAINEIIVAAPNEASLNGETWLIEHTSPFHFKTVFDVGANVGDWTKYARAHYRDADIHCFEILPATYQSLVANLSKMGPLVHPNPFGLSDEEAQVEVFFDSASSYVSSMYAFQVADRRESAMCRVRRGDDYASERGIQFIDFLKIDVEGAEAKVINGLSRMFSGGNIRLVQFEYNRGAIISRFLLADFYEFFEKHGYILGKLTPQGVVFREYHYAHEDFNGPNYVACRPGDTDLIRAIAAP